MNLVSWAGKARPFCRFTAARFLQGAKGPSGNVPVAPLKGGNYTL